MDQLPSGSIINFVHSKKYIGRVIKILTQNKRVIQYADLDRQRFLIREIEVKNMSLASDEEKLLLKRFAIEHNQRLSLEIKLKPKGEKNGA